MKKLLVGVVFGIALMAAAAAGAVGTQLFTVRSGDHLITSQQSLGCAVTSGPTITCGIVARPRGYFIAINAGGILVTRNGTPVFAKRCC
jgi:hypothetical protein